MNKKHVLALMSATAITLSVTGMASAGGFSRGTADTDILFEEGNFNVRTSVTYVSPTRKYSVNGLNPELVGVNYADSYVVPSAAVKFKIFDDMSCAGTYTQPFGAGATWPTPSGPIRKLQEDFVVNEFGATCGYKFDMGGGRLWVLGGVFAENVTYDLEAVAGALKGSLEDSHFGWRGGVAYEIPDIAFRAQVMYRSGFKVEADGTALIAPALTGLPISITQPATGAASLPQSVELKVQSGIAPGWLAYGSVKWMDWSVTQELVLNVPSLGLQSKNDYYWRDGWTVTAGVGHAFNDKMSGTAFVSWDRGTSTGWDLTGDTYTFGIGGQLKDKFGELRFGAAALYLDEVSETNYPVAALNRTVQADWGYALSVGYGIKW